MKIVSKSTKEDAQNVLKITKSTKTVFAHHTILSVLPETFMKSVSVARMDTTLTQLPDAELPLWDATTLTVFVLRAELHSFTKDKLPPVSLTDAKNTSSEVVKLASSPTNSDTTHANSNTAWSQATADAFNATQITS